MHAHRLAAALARLPHPPLGSEPRTPPKPLASAFFALCLSWEVAPLTAAVIVTTPQKLAFIDVAKGVRMFSKLKVPCVAVVENMCYFDADGKRYYPFGKGSGAQACDLLSSSSEFLISLIFPFGQLCNCNWRVAKDGLVAAAEMEEHPGTAAEAREGLDQQTPNPGGRTKEEWTR
ncbi:hypothetical protein IEQ34_018538 [Dendrobium chrysotoxum]|uniref:Uncharacterized protein n=1 Tax=Dendrobium chrysotoxum TaxID=161865 RepID=A0AAV7G5H1_DENCH|nr:hypothetical protein IEQ34_018538 [Dendrobium chrysotoxum]